MECPGRTSHAKNNHEIQGRTSLDESERGHEPKLSVCKFYDPPVVAGSETTVERVYRRDDPLVVGSDAKQSDREGIERIDKRKLKENDESQMKV